MNFRDLLISILKDLDYHQEFQRSVAKRKVVSLSEFYYQASLDLESYSKFYSKVYKLSVAERLARTRSILAYQGKNVSKLRGTYQTMVEVMHEFPFSITGGVYGIEGSFSNDELVVAFLIMSEVAKDIKK